MSKIGSIAKAAKEKKPPKAPRAPRRAGAKAGPKAEPSKGPTPLNQGDKVLTSQRGRAQGVMRPGNDKFTMGPGNDVFTMGRSTGPEYTGPVRQRRKLTQGPSSQPVPYKAAGTPAPGTRMADGTKAPVRSPQLEVLSIVRNRRSSGTGRKAAMAAGAAVAGGAAVLATQDNNTKGGTTVPTKTAVAPAGNVPVVPDKTLKASTRNPEPSRPRTSNTPTGGGTQTAPKAATGGSRGTSGGSSRSGKKMQGKELADFLGLGADSAVRTYMQTGKHKYPSKGKGTTGTRTRGF